MSHSDYYPIPTETRQFPTYPFPSCLQTHPAALAGGAVDGFDDAEVSEAFFAGYDDGRAVQHGLRQMVELARKLRLG